MQCTSPKYAGRIFDVRRNSRSRQDIMTGTKFDRAWSDFLDSRRIYYIKLFTVGQRIAGRSNLPCGTNREEGSTHAHVHTYKISERARKETRDEGI